MPVAVERKPSPPPASGDTLSRASPVGSAHCIHCRHKQGMYRLAQHPELGSLWLTVPTDTPSPFCLGIAYFRLRRLLLVHILLSHVHLLHRGSELVTIPALAFLCCLPPPLWHRYFPYPSHCSCTSVSVCIGFCCYAPIC